MSSTEMRSEDATQNPKAGMVDLKLEVVILPVSDVERAKRFYQRLGWRLDADFASGDDWRVVQLTPPGSPCSILFGKGITSAVPGSVQAPPQPLIEALGAIDVGHRKDNDLELQIDHPSLRILGCVFTAHLSAAHGGLRGLSRCSRPSPRLIVLSLAKARR